jgi:hypothetical protein
MTDPLTEGMARFFEITGPVREATIGYKRSLTDAGINDTIADEMAGDFHRFCLSMLLKTALG